MQLFSGVTAHVDQLHAIDLGDYIEYGFHAQTPMALQILVPKGLQAYDILFSLFSLWLLEMIGLTDGHRFPLQILRLWTAKADLDSQLRFQRADPGILPHRW
jgi:hypothetical protein